MLFTVQLGAAVAACPASNRVGISDRGFTSFRTPDSYAGISVDIFKGIARRSGCRIELVTLPNVRLMFLMIELKAGNIDVVASIPYRAERRYAARYLPHGYARHDLIVSRRIPGRCHSLADFISNSTARLNLVRGFDYQQGHRVAVAGTGAASLLRSAAIYAA